MDRDGFLVMLLMFFFVTILLLVGSYIGYVQCKQDFKDGDIYYERVLVNTWVYKER